MRKLFIILCVLLAAGTAQAQRGPGGRQAAAPQADKEALKKRIRAMRVWYLTEELELDDATAARLFPILGTYDDQLEALQVEGARLRRELRKRLARRGNQADAGPQVDALLAHYDRVYQLQRERIVAARKVLSPAQTGRLILVLPRVDNAIRRQIGRVMRGQDGRAERRRDRTGRRTSTDLEDPYAEDGDVAPAAPRRAPAAESRRRDGDWRNRF